MVHIYIHKLPLKMRALSSLITRLSTCKHAFLPSRANPSCAQTTLASRPPQPSSHTVPHVRLMQISTRPSSVVDPLSSRMSPSVQSGGTGLRLKVSYQAILN